MHRAIGGQAPRAGARRPRGEACDPASWGGAALAATLALLVGPAYAATNLVTNGSFASGAYQPNQFTICECNIRPGDAAATAITGWSVVAPANALPASGIDWLQNYPQYLPLPSDGTKNLDPPATRPARSSRRLRRRRARAIR